MRQIGMNEEEKNKSCRAILYRTIFYRHDLLPISPFPQANAADDADADDVNNAKYHSLVTYLHLVTLNVHLFTLNVHLVTLNVHLVTLNGFLVKARSH